MGRTHPERSDRPINDVQSAELESGQKAVFEWLTEGTGTVVVLPELAISKEPATTYTIEVDGAVRFEAEIPPTDIDDSGQTWLPPLEFSDDLVVTVRNFSNSTIPYHCQPKGWETSEESQ